MESIGRYITQCDVVVEGDSFVCIWGEGIWLDVPADKEVLEVVEPVQVVVRSVLISERDIWEPYKVDVERAWYIVVDVAGEEVVLTVVIRWER